MSLSTFRTYQLSIQFYRQALTLRVPSHLRDQFLRAASSVTLNLAEGSAKPTLPDRLKFYRISLGSQRECAAILELLPESDLVAAGLCDQLGAYIYKLVTSAKA